MEKKIICLCSGGLDSLALVHFFKSSRYDIIILYVNYGQLSYNQEFNAVKKITEVLKIENLIKIDLFNYGKFFSNSLVKKDELLNDYFPGRNLLLLTLAASLAHEKKIQEIGIGVIGSTRIFPDCEADFFTKLEGLFALSFNYNIGIHTPLEHFTKLEIIKYLKKYNLPIKITYSCQKGGETHCNKCPSCIERINAIKSL